jgi:hypothetical protein
MGRPLPRSSGEPWSSWSNSEQPYGSAWVNASTVLGMTSDPVQRKNVMGKHDAPKPQNPKPPPPPSPDGGPPPGGGKRGK